MKGQQKKLCCERTTHVFGQEEDFFVSTNWPMKRLLLSLYLITKLSYYIDIVTKKLYK